MYRRYRTTCDTTSPHSSSECSPASSEPSRYRYNYGRSFDPSPYWNEYYYGRRRRRPYYWDRDRDTYNRLWRNRRRRRRNRRREERSADDQPSRDSSPEPEPPAPPPKPEPPKEEIVEKLHIKDINLHIKENAEKHHTDKYECIEEYEDDAGKKQAPELVARRGEFIKMTITFNKPYEKNKHDCKLCFSIGKKPSIPRKTMAQFEIDEDGKKEYKPNEWGGYLESCSGNDITIQVHIAADCIVGEWNVTVKTIAEGKDENGKEKTLIFQYEHDDDINILFNPWCKDDDTYMEDKKLLNEYVLNENGCVYRGNAWTRGAKPWNFGQFEQGVLEICMYLLRCGFRDGISKSMADPIEASRIIAKMVNSSDDDGVLTGRWDGKYDDGVAPSSWMGTPKILKQFMKSGPVKYGQCWVFSCVTTTVCRCLGIPCRTVTNFASAHDSDCSNMIEKVYVEIDGKLEKDHNYTDSVWNFHVWNEVWLKRADLDKKGYDGWQVIDATPQETSGGVYTCGPCPVSAIKEGQVDVHYDTAFVFSEVNADECKFTRHPDGTYELMDHGKKKIGMNISTKVPDGKPYKDETYGAGGMRFDRMGYDEKKREDLTKYYKYDEGSEEERKAVMKAFKLAKCYREYLDPYKEKTVEEKIEYKLRHSNEVMIGDDLEVEMYMKNLGSRPRKIYYVELKVAPKSYTGDVGENFFSKMFEEINLEKGEEKSFKVTLTAKDYFKHLVEQASLEIEYTAFSDDFTSSKFKRTVKTHDFRFRRPDLEVEGPETGEIGKPVSFTVSFTNPVPTSLTKCKISMGSSGFKDIEDKKQPDVGVSKEYKETFTMVPKRKKEHEVIFTFDCAELPDIAGSTMITIK